MDFFFICCCCFCLYSCTYLSDARRSNHRSIKSLADTTFRFSEIIFFSLLFRFIFAFFFGQQNWINWTANGRNVKSQRRKKKRSTLSMISLLVFHRLRFNRPYALFEKAIQHCKEREIVRIHRCLFELIFVFISHNLSFDCLFCNCSSNKN